MQQASRFKLFVDLDGVLVDFERGVEAVTGRSVGEQSPRSMWAALARSPDFYANLAWTGDGRRLWEFILPFSPTVLTGLPFGKWAEPQKVVWCRRELGPAVPVITCMSREKAHRAAEVTPSGYVPLLIDDREKGREAWEAIPGVFVLHTSAEDSISRLVSLGVALN